MRTATTKKALLLAAFVVFIVGVILLVSPRASADEGDYLSDLSSHGLPTTSVSLSVGYQICGDIATNGTAGVQHEANLALSAGLTTKTVSIVMYDAVADLCPSQMPTLMAWVHSSTGETTT